MPCSTAWADSKGALNWQQHPLCWATLYALLKEKKQSTAFRDVPNFSWTARKAHACQLSLLCFSSVVAGAIWRVFPSRSLRAVCLLSAVNEVARTTPSPGEKQGYEQTWYSQLWLQCSQPCFCCATSSDDCATSEQWSFTLELLLFPMPKAVPFLPAELSECFCAVPSDRHRFWDPTRMCRNWMSKFIATSVFNNSPQWMSLSDASSMHILQQGGKNKGFFSENKVISMLLNRKANC